MNGQLVQVCRPSNSSLELIASVATLRQEVADLTCRSRAPQTREPRIPPAGRILEESPSRCPAPRSPSWSRKSNNSKGKNANSKPISSGRRSETTTRSDRSNHLDDPQDDSQEPQRKRGQQPENPGPKRRDYSHLPVREKIPRTAPRAMCLSRLRPALAFPMATRKTPSKSRSKCVPTAG